MARNVIYYVLNIYIIQDYYIHIEIYQSDSVWVNIVNNFSVMSGWSKCFLGLTSTVGS